MTRPIRLRHICRVNPSTREFVTLPGDKMVTFLGLDAVWPDAPDTSSERPWHEVRDGYTRFREGDVLLPKITPTFEADRAAVAEGLRNGLGCGTTELHVLRAGARLNTRFLYYLTRSWRFLQEGAAEMHGVAGQKRVPQSFVENFEVFLPSPALQRDIVRLLDRETARIRELIRKKRALLDVLSQKESGLIDEQTGADRFFEYLRSGVEVALDSGERVSRLMYLTEDSRPIMYGIVLPGPDVEVGVPLIKGGNVERGALELDDLARTAEEIEAKHGRSRVKEGDIVFSIRGSAGAARMVPRHLAGANMTQDVARISPRSGVDSRWLLFALRSTPVLAQLESGMVGATIRGINIRDLKRVRLLTPSSEKQKEIGDELGERLGQIDALRRTVRNQLGLLEEHRRALIAEAVCGQLPLKTA